MQEIMKVLFRTIFFYFFSLVAFRIMGKREVGQLGVIDLVISILIAELIAISIENIKDSMWNTVIPILALVILEIILGYASLKSKKFRTFFDGKPSVIIENGKVNYKEMVKQRYTIDDLLFELRQKGIKSLADIEFAFLESNGKLSIFKKQILNKDYPMPLIVDGKVQVSTLKKINKSKIWLDYKLKQSKLKTEDVFYAFYKGYKLFVIEYKDMIKVD